MSYQNYTESEDISSNEEELLHTQDQTSFKQRRSPLNIQRRTKQIYRKPKISRTEFRSLKCNIKSLVLTTKRRRNVSMVLLRTLLTCLRSLKRANTERKLMGYLDRKRKSLRTISWLWIVRYSWLDLTMKLCWMN